MQQIGLKISGSYNSNNTITNNRFDLDQHSDHNLKTDNTIESYTKCLHEYLHVFTE